MLRNRLKEILIGKIEAKELSSEEFVVYGGVAIYFISNEYIRPFNGVVAYLL